MSLIPFLAQKACVRTREDFGDRDGRVPEPSGDGKHQSDTAPAVPKYPLVLVHGAFIRDVAFLRSFGKIDRELEKNGCTVFVAKTDAFGTVESNAEMLKQQIGELQEKTGCEKVNIIAHSKGGLDARYLIETLGFGPNVASLTTLCTPHAGSPVASAILRFPRPLLKVVAFFFNTFYRICGDRHPDSLTVCEQLKRKENGNANADPIPGVYCQSFSSTVVKGAKKNDFVMRIPAAFCRFYEKGTETDGLVSRDSAIFGVYRGDCIDGSVSHSEIIDFMTGAEKRRRVYAFYGELCDGLAQKGL